MAAFAGPLQFISQLLEDTQSLGRVENLSLWATLGCLPKYTPLLSNHGSSILALVLDNGRSMPLWTSAAYKCFCRDR
jgi:hypothetical protein